MSGGESQCCSAVAVAVAVTISCLHSVAIFAIDYCSLYERFLSLGGDVIRPVTKEQLFTLPVPPLSSLPPSFRYCSCCSKLAHWCCAAVQELRNNPWKHRIIEVFGKRALFGDSSSPASTGITSTSPSSGHGGGSIISPAGVNIGGLASETKRRGSVAPDDRKKRPEECMLYQCQLLCCVLYVLHSDACMWMCMAVEKWEIDFKNFLKMMNAFSPRYADQE